MTHNKNSSIPAVTMLAWTGACLLVVCIVSQAHAQDLDAGTADARAADAGAGDAADEHSESDLYENVAVKKQPEADQPPPRDASPEEFEEEDAGIEHKAMVERTPNPDRLTWKYPRVRWWQYALTFTAPLALELLEVSAGEPQSPNWRGGILFDDAVRDFAVGGTFETRDLADKVSDIGMLAMWVTPTLLDGIILSLLVEGAPDVAWQVIAINMQALGTSALTTLALIYTVKRERPLAQECETNPEYSPLCSQGTYKGFPSGHTASAFMGAGLICAHHTNLELFGSPGDEIMCGSSLVAAGAMAYLRLVADRHYASDLIVGAAIGLGLGWLVPWLLHYNHEGELKKDVTLSISPLVGAPMTADDRLLGLQLGGWF